MRFTHWERATRGMASLAFFAVSITAFAIGPHDQRVTPNFDAVVRVLFNNNNANPNNAFGTFNGTGAVIDYKVVNGQSWICVLTADHVVSKNGTAAGADIFQPGIAFNDSPDDTGDGGYGKAAILKRAGPTKKWDLAVLGIKVSASNYFPRACLANPNCTNFSIIGYGNEGRIDNVNGGYQPQGKYGKQRYMNSGVRRYFANYSLFGGYMNNVVEYEVVNPATSILPGTGTPFDADSGSPYLTTAPFTDTAKNIAYYRDTIFAVHHGTDRGANAGPNGFKAWAGNPNGWSTTMNYGVHLNQEYLDWIRMQCAMVPEPATLTAMTLGTLVLAARRRRLS